MTDTLAEAQGETADASQADETTALSDIGARSKAARAAVKEVTWVEEATNVLDDDELQEETQDRSDGVISRLALRAPPADARKAAQQSDRDKSESAAVVAGPPAVDPGTSAVTKVEGRASTVNPTGDQTVDQSVDPTKDLTTGQAVTPQPTPAEAVAAATDVPAQSGPMHLQFEQPEEYAPSKRGPGHVLRYLVPLAAVLLAVVGYFAVGRSDSGTQPQHAANDSVDDQVASQPVRASEGEPEVDIAPDPDPNPDVEPTAAEPELDIAPDPEPNPDVEPTTAEPELEFTPEPEPEPKPRQRQSDNKNNSASKPGGPIAPPSVRDRAAAKELHKAAMGAFVRGALPAAEKGFQKALRADPTFTVALRGLALVYERRGAKTKAAATFRRYLKLEPRAKDAKAIRSRLKQLEK